MIELRCKQCNKKIAEVTAVTGSCKVAWVCPRCGHYNTMQQGIIEMCATKGRTREGLKILICVRPDEPGFHAFCPSLPGVHTYGLTQQEAIASAKDAVMAYLLSLAVEVVEGEGTVEQNLLTVRG